MGHPAGTGRTPGLDSNLSVAEQAVSPVGVVAECDIAEGILPGRGLTAHYASVLANRPGGAGRFLRASGVAVSNHLARSGGRHGDLSEDFPLYLISANRRGFRQGLFVYPLARVRAWRLRRAKWAGVR